MLPLLKIAALGETRVPDASEKIADQLSLDEVERSQMLPSGRQRLLHNRVHWAKFYLTKAGLLDVPTRGRFLASKSGKALLATGPKMIDVDLLKTYPIFAEYYRKFSERPESTEELQTKSPAALSTTPEEQVDAAYSVMRSALRIDLLQRILANSPSFFELLIVELLVAMGYGGSHENAALRLGKSGDGGIDGVVDEDRLGLDRIYVQAKRYAPHVSVGRPEIQGFVGSLVGVGAMKGVFVTTSSFSNHAIDYARHLAQRVILIDGERLSDLMIEHGVGVRIVRTVDFKRLDEDFFSEE